MFHLGWSEMLVVACLALVVVGPKDLPHLLRSVARGVGQARRVFRDLRSSVEDVISPEDMKLLRGDVAGDVFGQGRSFDAFLTDRSDENRVKQSADLISVASDTSETISEKEIDTSGVPFHAGQALAARAPDVPADQSSAGDENHHPSAVDHINQDGRTAAQTPVSPSKAQLTRQKKGHTKAYKNSVTQKAVRDE